MFVIKKALSDLIKFPLFEFPEGFLPALPSFIRRRSHPKLKMFHYRRISHVLPRRVINHIAMVRRGGKLLGIRLTRHYGQSSGYYLLYVSGSYIENLENIPYVGHG